MDYLIKIAVSGIVISLIVLLLKGFKSELTPALTIMGSVIILGCVLSMVKNAADAVGELFNHSQIESENIKSIMKIVGSAYIAEFASSICRDMGDTSTASKIELAGRVFIILTAIPWAATLIETLKVLGK